MPREREVAHARLVLGIEALGFSLGSLKRLGPPLKLHVVVKIMVPFWVPNIARHLIFRVPQKGLDNHPCSLRVETGFIWVV